jgi:hypothetical protein
VLDFLVHLPRYAWNIVTRPQIILISLPTLRPGVDCARRTIFFQKIFRALSMVNKYPRHEIASCTRCTNGTQSATCVPANDRANRIRAFQWQKNACFLISRYPSFIHIIHMCRWIFLFSHRLNYVFVKSGNLLKPRILFTLLTSGFLTLIFGFTPQEFIQQDLACCYNFVC